MDRPLYSPCVSAGDLVFVAGQRGALDGKIVEGGIVAELKQAFTNIASILATQGLGLDNVVKVTVFLRGVKENVAPMNEAYLELFKGRPPARTLVGVAELTSNALIAVDAIAFKGKN
jgi:enamine deaminase RidA (YjgF/YER057c/UK114 family)